jgi:hypothetical protein
MKILPAISRPAHQRDSAVVYDACEDSIKARAAVQPSDSIVSHETLSYETVCVDLQWPTRAGTGAWLNLLSASERAHERFGQAYLDHAAAARPGAALWIV